MSLSKTDTLFIHDDGPEPEDDKYLCPYTGMYIGDCECYNERYDEPYDEDE